jgi:hypothetical protein
MSTPFWRLSSGKQVAHRITQPAPDSFDWKSLDDLRTEPLAARWPQLTIQLREEFELPDYFASGTKPILSKRLRALCEEQFRVNAEFLPLKIVGSDGKMKSESFSVLHPLERIDCIDYEASQFDRYGDDEDFTIARFRSLVFRPQVIGDRALFRPQRYPAMYVSNEFREAVLAGHLVVKFYPLEGAEKAAGG